MKRIIVFLAFFIVSFELSAMADPASDDKDRTDIPVCAYEFREDIENLEHIFESVCGAFNWAKYSALTMVSLVVAKKLWNEQ